MADTWQNLTIADVFSGPASTLQNISKEADDLNLKLDSVLRQLNDKANAIQGIIGTTANLLDGITNSGVSVLYLEPNSGGLVSRISSALNPPSGSYSAGIVLGISTVDLASALDTYQKLINMLTTPIEVPK